MTLTDDHAGHRSEQFEQLLAFIPGEPAEAPRSAGRRAWQILIVDAEDTLHCRAQDLLRGIELEGRPVELLRAHGAQTALNLLHERRHVAVVLIDVPAQTPEAGLTLAAMIRGELGLDAARLLLCAAPGVAQPDFAALRRCDIDDCRSHSELGGASLLNVLSTALRAYAQAQRLQAASRGMRAVAQASNELFRLRAERDFAVRLIERLEAILGQRLEGFVAIERVHGCGQEGDLFLEHACGCYASLASARIDDLDTDTLRSVRRCMAAHTAVFEPGRVLFWLGNGARDALALIEHGRELDALEVQLVSMFAANLVVGFENVDLIERLNFFAFSDPLTGLPNRTAFMSRVDQRLITRSSQEEALGLLLADVAHFSGVNAALGARSGDLLLIEVARRLRRVLGDDVELARLAGDCFAAFGPLRVLDSAGLQDAFAMPVFVHGHAMSVQLYVGRCTVESKGERAAELLRNAGLALADARRQGAGALADYRGAMHDAMQARIELLHGLRSALDFRRGLSLAYQPVVHSQDGSVVAVEALLRWRSEQGEQIPPARFIPLAEGAGMMGELGLWVLDEALTQLAAWEKAGLGAWIIAVNLSAAQLRAADFAEQVAQRLAAHGIAADRLCFEVGEMLLHEAGEFVRLRLAALRELGVRLAIDDFGTTSAMLHEQLGAPAEVAKLAPDYVRQAASASPMLASSVFELARQSGRTVVAEGVETAAQADALRALGCEFLQGFHLAHPMNAQDFERWFRKRSAPADSPE